MVNCFQAKATHHTQEYLAIWLFASRVIGHLKTLDDAFDELLRNLQRRADAEYFLSCGDY